MSVWGNVLDLGSIEISYSTGYQWYSAVAFDGTNYVVIWQDIRNGNWDIYGVLFDLNGALIQSFTVSTQSGNQIDPALAIGSGSQIFTVYSGFIDQINNKPVNTMRIWGYQYSLIGIREDLFSQRISLMPNIPNPFIKPTEISYKITDQVIPKELSIFDVQGRMIRVLKRALKTPGIHRVVWKGTDENGFKVCNGIYFVRRVAGKHKEVRKVMLMREYK